MLPHEWFSFFLQKKNTEFWKQMKIPNLSEFPMSDFGMSVSLDKRTYGNGTSCNNLIIIWFNGDDLPVKEENGNRHWLSVL